jgi:hypothetical protein
MKMHRLLSFGIVGFLYLYPWVLGIIVIAILVGYAVGKHSQNRIIRTLQENNDRLGRMLNEAQETTRKTLQSRGREYLDG